MCSLCKLDVESDREEIHKLKCSVLKYKCELCEQEINKIDYKDHLINCKNQISYCKELEIYYPWRFHEAFMDEFKNIIMKYHLFYKNIKEISRLLI